MRVDPDQREWLYKEHQETLKAARKMRPAKRGRNPIIPVVLILVVASIMLYVAYEPAMEFIDKVRDRL